MANRRRDEEYEEEYEEEDRPRKRGGGAMSHIVPTGNPMALTSYYLGIGALIPLLGLLLGPIAIILGIIGFVKANNNPEAKGTAHAIIGVLLGLGGFFVCGPLGAILGYAALIGPK